MKEYRMGLQLSTGVVLLSSFLIYMVPGRVERVDSQGLEDNVFCRVCSIST